MKKIMLLLIGLFLLPNIVNADMSAPLTISYDVRVSNPNGAYEYDSRFDEEKKEWILEKTGRIIPYGTVLEISYEDDLYDGYIDLFVYDYRYVKIEDLESLDSELKANNEFLKEKTFEILIIKDTEIKSGPGLAYETIGTIKAGEKVDARFVDYFSQKDLDNYDKLTDDEKKFLDNNKKYQPNESVWRYVEYNDIKGYISIYYANAASNIQELSLIALRDITIEDINDNNKKKEIKSGTIFTAKIGYLNQWVKYGRYIEIDGIKGYIGIYDFTPKRSKKTQAEIVEDTNLYSDGDIYLMEDMECKTDEEDNCIIDESKIITTLKSGTTFESEYIFDYGFYDEDISLIYYNKDGKEGFVVAEDVSYKFDYEDVEDILSDINYSDYISENNIGISGKPKKNNTLYICVGGGIIISLTAIVTIILINKKKKALA